MMKRTGAAAAAAILLFFSLEGAGDEGMYTFDNPPLGLWKDRYGFVPDSAWIERAMKASVRFTNGGSGAFVSGQGLVMTNHHVGLDCIQKISSPGKDFVLEGFLATRREEEVGCHDLEINALVSMEDMTERVTKAVEPAASEEEAAKARRKVTAEIEKECSERTGLRCNVVVLYGGGQYMLYRYRKYTDIRLVFAPERQIAFFGGDFDNFTYPRHDYDVAFFRVYENGKPLRPEHFFGWSSDGAADGELVFVTGNPGTTGRLLTVSQIEFQRDTRNPNRIRSFERALGKLKEYASKGKENERQAAQWIFSFENAIKAYKGFDAGLRDPKIFEAKKKEEERLKAAAAKHPDLHEKVKESWKKIAEAQREHAQFHAAYYIAQAAAERSELLRRGFMIVQMAAEKKKPNEERFEEFRDSAIESAELDLYSGAPIYKGLEEVILRNSLEEAVEVLGDDHPFVKASLGGRSPAEAASLAVEGTRLFEVEYRKDLVKKADRWSLKKWERKIRKVKDQMIQMALRIDPVLRDLRKRYEERIESVEEVEGRKICGARFRIFGRDLPPDATFTPRIAFGVVKGYEAEGTIVPPFTNFLGLFSRSFAFGGKPPFDLPKRWIERKGALRMETPLNFVATPDIVGGNSGSPVINARGEIVGLIFDGNIESHVLRYFYTEEKARAIAVHSEGIREALVKIYGAGGLAKELGS